MTKISEMIPSKYLKQSDFEVDYIVTIEHLEEVNIAPQDADKDEFKWTVTFKEFDKPMVLNSTNIQLLAKACDSDETDDWIGKQVIVYSDPNITFGGKLVGGLRVKKYGIPRPMAPKHRQTAPARGQPAARGRSDSEDFANQKVPADDIPF